MRLLVCCNPVKTLPIILHIFLRSYAIPFQTNVSCSDVIEGHFVFMVFHHHLHLSRSSIDSLGVPNKERDTDTLWAYLFGVTDVLIKLLNDVRLRLGVAGDKLLKRTADL